MSWPLRFARWVVDHVIGMLLTLGVTALAGLLITQLHGGKPKPIDEQLDQIRHAAAQQGLFAVVNHATDLRGTGAKSWFFVFRPRLSTRVPTEGASDEIRIYDLQDGKLKPAFRYQPRQDGSPPYQFEVSGIGRFGETDREEAIGQYVHKYVDTDVSYPVAVDWDEGAGGAGRYKLRSLLPGPPQLRGFPHPGRWVETARRSYLGTTLRNRTGPEAVQVYGTDFFKVSRQPFPVLAAAFTVKAECNACTRTFEVKAWHLDFQQPLPAAWACDDNGGVLIRSNRTFDPVTGWLRRTPPALRRC